MTTRLNQIEERLNKVLQRTFSTPPGIGFTEQQAYVRQKHEEMNENEEVFSFYVFNDLKWLLEIARAAKKLHEKIGDGDNGPAGAWCEEWYLLDDALKESSK